MRNKEKVLYSISKELTTTSSSAAVIRVATNSKYFVYYNSLKDNLLLYSTDSQQQEEEEDFREIPNVLNILVDGSIELLELFKEDLLLLLFYSKSQSIIQLVNVFPQGDKNMKIHLFNSPFKVGIAEIIDLKLYYTENVIKMIVLWSVGVVEVVCIKGEDVMEKEYYRLGDSFVVGEYCYIIIYRKENDDVIIISSSKEYVLWRDCARITKDNDSYGIFSTDSIDGESDGKKSILYDYFKNIVNALKSITTTTSRKSKDKNEKNNYDDDVVCQIEYIQQTDLLLLLTAKGKLYKKALMNYSGQKILLNDSVAALLEGSGDVELYNISYIKNYSNDSILLFLNDNKYLCIVSNDFSKLEYIEEIEDNDSSVDIVVVVVVDYVSAGTEEGKLYFVTKTLDSSYMRGTKKEDSTDFIQWLYLLVYSFFLYLLNCFYSTKTIPAEKDADNKDSLKFTSTLWKLWKSTPLDLLMMMIKEQRFSDAKEFALEYGLNEQELLKQEFISSGGLLKLLENIVDDDFVFESIINSNLKSTFSQTVEECFQNELKLLQYGLQRFSSIERVEKLKSLVEYLETTRLLCFKGADDEEDDVKNFVAFYKYYRLNGAEGLQQHAMYFARDSSKRDLFGLLVQRHYEELTEKRMDLLESIVEVELLEYKDTILQLWSEQCSEIFKEWILEKCVQIDEQSGQIDLSFHVYQEFVLDGGSNEMDMNGRVIKLIRDLVFSGHLMNSNKSILRSVLFVSDSDLERLKFLYAQLESKKRDSLIFSLVCEELELSLSAIEEFVKEQSINEVGLLLEYLRHYYLAKSQDRNDFIDSLLHSNQVVIKDSSSLSVLKEIRKLYSNNAILNSLITLIDTFKLYSYSLKKLYESSKDSLLTKLLSFYKQENDLYTDYKYIKDILESDDYYLEYLKALLLSKNDKKISMAQSKLKEYYSQSAENQKEEDHLSGYFFLNIYLEYYNNSNSIQDELLQYARRILTFGIELLDQDGNDADDEDDVLLLQELRYLDAVCRIFGSVGYNNNANNSSSIRALLPSQVRLASEDRRLKMINLSSLAGSYRSKDDLKALIDDFLCNAKKDSSQLPIMFKFNLMLCKFYADKKDFRSVTRIITEITQEYKQTVQYPSEFFRIVADSLRENYDFDLLSQTISLFYGQSEHEDCEVIDELLNLCDEHQNINGHDDPKYQCLSYLAKGLQDLNDITVKHLMKTNWAEVSEFADH